jgi:hypothetical protein
LETGLCRAVFVFEFSAARVHRYHRFHPESRDRYRKVVEHAAIDAQPSADRAGRIKPWQRARCVHRVGNAYVAQTRQSPHDLRATRDVDGVDEQRPLQLIEALLGPD